MSNDTGMTTFSICSVTGNHEWTENGKYHRPDAPAKKSPSGFDTWYLHGRRHRIGGPARLSKYGNHLYFINGTKYDDAKRYQLAAEMSDEEMMVMVLKYGRQGLK